MIDEFEKYLHLYKTGISIRRVNPINDQTYRVLVKSNIDIRIIDRDANLALISSLGNFKNFTKDTKDYSSRFFYSIPVQTIKGTIVGFIFRTVFGKNYTTVNRRFNDKDCKLPLMFGFYGDFEDFDQYDECNPIIICEGLKDCITLKRIYPYVLANNTSSMGINFQVLSNLTDKFILVYDNDDAGQKGMASDGKHILDSRYDMIIVRPKECYKDAADCSENREDFIAFAKELRQKIKLFKEGNILALSRNYLDNDKVGRRDDYKKTIRL